MTIERTSAQKALMDEHGLPWPKADENAASRTQTSLGDYEAKLSDDRADAAKAVQRLLSSGHGEAMTALAGHWDRVNGHFTATAAAAVTIAAQLLTCADDIAVHKDMALGVVERIAPGLPAPAAGSVRPPLEVAQQSTVESARAELKSIEQEAFTDTASRLTAARTDPRVAGLPDIPADLSGGSAGGRLGAGLAPGIAGGAGTVGATGPGIGPGIVGGGIAGGAGAGGAGAGGAGAGGAGAVGAGQHAPDASPGRLRGGGPAVGTPQSFRIDFWEHTRAANRLAEIADQIADRTTTALARAMYDLEELRRSGSLGASVAEGFAPLLDDLDLATRALGHHLGGPLRDAVRAAGEDQKQTDDDHKKWFGRLD
ncbi:hypothetical protein [Streptomyces sp. NRRL B-24572]|uniref:hypothetical protein n=1 Tax=Streptomyces sp. NRRL B-24572 TaxID=1962156 RepID=UPI000A39D237|nr:hypothetical protein [Streptomyces sp. NRRL B-24572]